eukprot:3538476-Pleurochrysis_carterae.AAC.1
MHARHTLYLLVAHLSARNARALECTHTAVCTACTAYGLMYGIRPCLHDPALKYPSKYGLRPYLLHTK